MKIALIIISIFMVLFAFNFKLEILDNTDAEMDEAMKKQAQLDRDIQREKEENYGGF